MAVDLRWQRNAFQLAKVNATLGGAGIHKMNRHGRASCRLKADVQSLALQCSARSLHRQKSKPKKRIQEKCNQINMALLAAQVGRTASWPACAAALKIPGQSSQYSDFSVGGNKRRVFEMVRRQRAAAVASQALKSV